MSNKIKINNIIQLSYPPEGTSFEDNANALAEMSIDGKLQIAAELSKQIPIGKISFKYSYPMGLQTPECGAKYFGNVRYVEQWNCRSGLMIARMDIGYGDEVK